MTIVAISSSTFRPSTLALTANLHLWSSFRGIRVEHRILRPKVLDHSVLIPSERQLRMTEDKP